MERKAEMDDGGGAAARGGAATPEVRVLCKRDLDPSWAKETFRWNEDVATVAEVFIGKLQLGAAPTAVVLRLRGAEGALTLLDSELTLEEAITGPHIHNAKIKVVIEELARPGALCWR